MKTISAILLLISTIIFFSCESRNNESINGLWEVKLVTSGKEGRTPNARWMRFNADSTQQSGNGWLQHSIGTWSYNERNKELFIHNENGLIDTNGPFIVRMNNDTMYWNRVEEGEKIVVKLEKTEVLPTTYSDKLLGLWQLDEAKGDGDYFKQGKHPNNYIFFRWDRRIVLGTPSGRIHGVYNVHGHKAELELIPYNEDLKRSFWTINYNENSITIKLLNSDNAVERTFTRIHNFPN